MSSREKNKVDFHLCVMIADRTSIKSETYTLAGIWLLVSLLSTFADTKQFPLTKTISIS
jgi:hypothetical protein